MTETVSIAPGEVTGLVEHLFRLESGKMVATLTRIFGVEYLTLAEDVVQEALARALKTWPFYGVPENPSAWILRASRNLALDVVRREAVFRGKEAEIVHSIELSSSTTDAPGFTELEIADDRLRLMFVCCHPVLPAEAQVALALKTLCGFSPAEIARAFLTSEAAIAKRLTRARQKIREAQIPFEIPEGEQLAQRLDGVLHSLYLLFNEGYKASVGDRLVREDICQEAIRLARLLGDHPAGRQPRTHALLALMLFHASRIRTRLDDAGNLLRLQDQDRSVWDRKMIAEGILYLSQSAAGSEASRYHLQAAIAASHCLAPDYTATDWPRVLELYDRLVEIDDSPVVVLNRAVAVAEVRGPEAGLAALRTIRDRADLQDYYLLHAVMGEFEGRLNHPAAAAAHFHKSLQLAEVKSERAFLSERLTKYARPDAHIAR